MPERSVRSQEQRGFRTAPINLLSSYQGNLLDPSLRERIDAAAAGAGQDSMTYLTELVSQNPNPPPHHLRLWSLYDLGRRTVYDLTADDLGIPEVDTPGEDGFR
jgi:hypothetical protein